jgi:organic hydroperoxide reductase OsmC/OhrA
MANRSRPAAGRQLPLARPLQRLDAMKPYPHHYEVEARAGAEGAVVLVSESLPPFDTSPPEQFGGPGGCWSPETLLVGAVADCFVLTFRAIAKASGLPWTRLRAAASGTLDRAEGGPRFTTIEIEAALAVPQGVDEARALRLLEKAERGCLITRSLACPVALHARVESDGSD